MKILFTILAAALISISTRAQTPEKMSYQAVIRDAGNELVSDQVVRMHIIILQGSDTGTVVYSEILTPTTNSNGLISIQFGGAAYDTINWANGPYFIKTETDPTGGTAYTIIGASQLLTVPYALYANTSGNSTPGPQGKDGLSAYEVWLNQGNTGTEDQFIDSITGSQGPQGIQGIKGETDSLPIGEQGNLLTYDSTNWIAKDIVFTALNTGNNQQFSNLQPYLAVNYIIALTGVYPSRSSIYDPTIGEISMFGGTFAPRGWALCNGQLLPIASNASLFSILGTTYGGDGRTTFALPDLRGRTPIHSGSGPGLSSYRLGQKGGLENTTLNIQNLPSHSHVITYE